MLVSVSQLSLALQTFITNIIIFSSSSSSFFFFPPFYNLLHYVVISGSLASFASLRSLLPTKVNYHINKKKKKIFAFWRFFSCHIEILIFLIPHIEVCHIDISIFFNTKRGLSHDILIFFNASNRGLSHRHFNILSPQIRMSHRRFNIF